MYKQKGFTIVEVILAVLVLGMGIGLAVMYVNSRQGGTDLDTSKSTQNSSQQTAVTKEESADTKEYIFENAPIKFTYSADWKRATGGYLSLESGHCGQSVTSTAECVDYIMLIPSDEEYVNADQFMVNVGIFKKSGTQGAREWDEGQIAMGSDGGLVTQKSFKYGGLDVFRTTADYTNKNKEIRLRYAMTTDGYGVILAADMFDKTHYSFTGSRDYTQLESKLDELAKSFSTTNE